MAATPSCGRLPRPQHFLEAQCLSTKKARGVTPNNQKLRPPAIKSGAKSESRIFSLRRRILPLKNKDFDGDSYFDNSFVNYGLLGEGSFGEVFKVRSKEDGKFYAVKRTKECYNRGIKRRRTMKEVDQFEKLPKHSKCIQFFTSWRSNEHLYIQMELCENTLSYYCDENHEIPETLVWKYLVDLLLAVKHLHDHDLIHLDIKPANIFISKLNICKLGDFGLVLDLNSDSMADALEGDAKYVAKECIRGTYGKAADIFSLGITILELACDLDLPTDGSLWHDLRDGKLPCDLMEKMSPELREIIKLMMSPEPLQRPTVDQLLNLPSVQRVLEERKTVYRIAKVLVSLLDKFYSCAFLVEKVFNFFLMPFKQLWSRRIQCSTPKRSPGLTKHSPGYWDRSYSDDESYETSRQQDRTPKLRIDPSTPTTHGTPANLSPFSLCSDDSPTISSDRFNQLQIQPKKLIFEFDDDD